MRRKKSGFDTNFDSLMDILTCVVGVMVFVVIFMVMQARTVNVKMATPKWSSADDNSTRRIVLCQEGKVSLFDFDRGLDELIDGLNRSDVFELAGFAKKANRKNVNDGYHLYLLEADGRKLNIVVHKTPNAPSETVEDLKKPESHLAKIFNQFDPQKDWITFLVDEKSLEVFFKAREIAVAKGFATGWDPKTFSFPYTECLSGCGGGSSSGPGIASGTQ